MQTRPESVNDKLIVQDSGQSISLVLGSSLSHEGAISLFCRVPQSVWLGPHPQMHVPPDVPGLTRVKSGTWRIGRRDTYDPRPNPGCATEMLGKFMWWPMLLSLWIVLPVFVFVLFRFPLLIRFDYTDKGKTGFKKLLHHDRRKQ